MSELPAKSDKSLWPSIAMIAGLTLLAYFPALGGGYIWDDDDYVTNNANLGSVEGLGRIWVEPRSSPQYYPMVFTSFWVEQKLWGLRPLGFHLTNVLLHAGAAVLLWRLLVTLEVPGALLGACLFAVHPINVESVAWVTERKNVLSGVFYFAAALLFLKSKPSIALVAFIAALLSKTVTCSLPAALLLVFWWKRRKLTTNEIASLTAMFVVGLVMAITTAQLERSHVQAVGREWDLSAIDRILIAGRAVWFYASTILLPVNLSFIYPKWTIDPKLAWQWAFPVGVIVALLALWWMRDHRGRGPLVVALIFVGTLVPALGFFNIYPMRYSFVADHFAYLASAALITLIAVGLSRAGKSAWFVMVPLVVLTMVRAGVYRDEEKLWADAARKNPDSWMVRLNLAKVLIGRDRRAEAWPHMDLLVTLEPGVAETHMNYAASLRERGRLEESLAEYDLAVKLEGDPLPQSLYGRGRTLLEMNRVGEAIRDFQWAIELKPDMESAHRWLGVALERQRAQP